MDLALGSAMPIETDAVRRGTWQQGRVTTATPSCALSTPDIPVFGVAPGGVRTPLEYTGRNPNSQTSRDKRSRRVCYVRTSSVVGRMDCLPQAERQRSGRIQPGAGRICRGAVYPL